MPVIPHWPPWRQNAANAPLAPGAWTGRTSKLRADGPTCTAAGKSGGTVGSMLSGRRDQAAATAFLKPAIDGNGPPFVNNCGKA